MKSRLYSLLEQGILKKPRKALVTYRSLIEPVNADTTIGQFTLHGVISNDDPTVVLSDTINLYPSTDADHPYRTITIDLSPVKEITSVFYTLINPDNAFNLNCTINNIELISEQGNIPIGLGILEPEALAATSITATGFIANWTEIKEATGYKIDVSTDIDFTTFVSGYEDYDAGLVLTLPITGLAEDDCHFYRVRAYNATFTSMNSNEIHVGVITKDCPLYILTGYKSENATIDYEEDCICFTDTGVDYTGVGINVWYAPLLPWYTHRFKYEIDVKIDGTQAMDFYLFRTSGAGTDTYVRLLKNERSFAWSYDMGTSGGNGSTPNMLLLNNTWEHISIEFNNGTITIITTNGGTYTAHYNVYSVEPTSMNYCKQSSSYGGYIETRFKNLTLDFYQYETWINYTRLRCDDGVNYIRYSSYAFKDYRDDVYDFE